MKVMSFDNAKVFAGDIRDALRKKQNTITSGNGIIMEDNVISMGVFTLCAQPILFDSTCYGQVLSIFKNGKLQMAMPLDDSGQTTVYIGRPGTYIYEIEMLPGIPYFSIEKTYAQPGNYPAFSISITPPVKADMYPFATATEAQLTNMLASYYLGLYDSSEIALLKSDYMPIGAKRTIHLAHMDEGDGCDETHFGVNGDDYEFIIIGFEHDNLVEQYGEKTKALLTLHQDRVLYNNTTDDFYYYNNGSPGKADGGGRMHSSGNWPYASWKDCDRRIWCNNTYKNAIEQGILKHIKNVSKQTYMYDGNSYNFEVTEDNVFFLSEWECWGEQRYRSQEGNQYEYYQQNVKNLDKKPGYRGGSPEYPSEWKYTGAYWWLRSLCYSGDFEVIYGYSYSGDEPPEEYTPYCTYEYLTYYYGMAPAFCI